MTYILIQQSQTKTDIIECTQDSEYTIDCKPDASYTLLIKHHVGALNCTINLDRDSKATIIFVGNTSKETQVICSINGNAPGAHATIIGAYDVHNTHASFKTTQQHQAPHTTSILHMRKIVRNNATATYHGMIDIHKQAAQADASQKDYTLLLGDNARAESIPAIEVKTNDVRCMHGSALARVDAQQLHYMQTRGLDTNRAQQLLVDGFFSVVLATIEDESLRKHAYAYMGLEYE